MTGSSLVGSTINQGNNNTFHNNPILLCFTGHKFMSILKSAVVTLKKKAFHKMQRITRYSYEPEWIVLLFT